MRGSHDVTLLHSDDHDDDDDDDEEEEDDEDDDDDDDEEEEEDQREQVIENLGNMASMSPLLVATSPKDNERSG